MKNTDRELLFLSPYLKEVLWGGTKLQKEYGYKSDSDHIGEAWVVSANPHGLSTVRNGRFAGQTLDQVYREHPDWFRPDGEGDFSLLVKLIDAEQHLSVQVHPDDAYAYRVEHGCGKTECWYIVDCDEDADIVIGHHAQSKEELRELVENGEWDNLLQIIPIHKGDFFFIPSGTVHAIRRGTLILETQQNCDITYRLYDYDRLQNGKPRELHLQKALDVITCPQELPKSERCRISGTDPECAEGVRLIQCPMFTVEHWSVKKQVTFSAEEQYRIIDVLEGEGQIQDVPLHKGDHVLVPSGYGEVELKGTFEVISSYIGRTS